MILARKQATLKTEGAPPFVVITERQSRNGQESTFCCANFQGLSSNGFNVQAREAFPKNDFDEWIEQIQQTWSQSAQNILALARLISAARRSLPYGSWSRLWPAGWLPFSKRKGEMLVVIGQCVERLDAQNSAQLPAAWNTLYYLARLGCRRVQALIAEGRIHPGLSLREAQTLLARYRPETRRKRPRLILRDRLAKLAKFLRDNLGAWSPKEQQFASRQLLALAEEMEGVRKQDPTRRAKASPFHLRCLAKSANQPVAVFQTPRTYFNSIPLL